MTTQLDFWPRNTPGPDPIGQALTERETRVAAMLARGAGVKEIVREIGGTTGMVRSSIAYMRRRFEARSASHLVAILIKRELI